MGCFLGCFGREHEERRRERRRRLSAKRLPQSARRSESARSSSLVSGQPRGPRQPSLTQVTPGPSHGRLPLDPAVESAYCEKTFPLDQSVDCSSVKTFPPESTVDSVHSEKNLQQDSPIHSITQVKPPFHTPEEPAKAEVPEIRGAIEKKSSSLQRKKVTFDLNVTTYEPVEERCYSSDDDMVEETHKKSRLVLSPPCVAFPSNHRYQNCDNDGEIEALEEEEEEDEEEDYYYSDSEEEEGLDELDEGIALDEIGIRIEGNEEESYESYFSLSIDKERELYDNNNNEEVSSLIGTNNPSLTDIPGLLHTRDRSQFVRPVLNPVENLSQWKQAKVHLSEKLTSKDKSVSAKLDKENKGNEVSVDTSLSSWLVSPEISKVEEQASILSFNREDRPILGALTLDDIKESSVNSSPRRSPSRSPSHDDVPIIGTVGSYWSCSKGVGSRSTRFREEKMGNYHGVLL